MSAPSLARTIADAALDDVVRELAAHLALGHERRQPVAILEEFGDLSLDEAYLVQQRVVAHLVEFHGERAAGWKISCTGEEDRARIAATEPLAGVLLESAFVPDGSTIDLGIANGPLAEPELVLRLTRQVAHDATHEELADSLEVAAALEIPRSRFRDWWPEGQPPNLTKETLAADNAAAGKVVLAGDWRRLSVPEINSVECTLRSPDGTQRHGTAAAVHGSPLRSLSWLLDKLHVWGRTLPAGALVSSGTFMTPARVTPGTFVASFSLVGDVAATFAHEPSLRTREPWASRTLDVTGMEGAQA